MSDNKVRVSKTKQRDKQNPKEPKFRMVSKEKAMEMGFLKKVKEQENKREPIPGVRKTRPPKGSRLGPDGLPLQGRESKPAVSTKQKILSGIRRYYKGGKV